MSTMLSHGKESVQCAFFRWKISFVSFSVRIMRAIKNNAIVVTRKYLPFQHVSHVVRFIALIDDEINQTKWSQRLKLQLITFFFHGWVWPYVAFENVEINCQSICWNGQQLMRFRLFSKWTSNTECNTGICVRQCMKQSPKCPSI